MRTQSWEPKAPQTAVTGRTRAQRANQRAGLATIRDSSGRVLAVAGKPKAVRQAKKPGPGQAERAWAKESPETEKLFQRAQAHYIRGDYHWAAALAADVVKECATEYVALKARQIIRACAVAG